MKTQEIAKMKLSTLWIAIGFAVISLTTWELYCRSKQYQVAPNDDKYLWAHHRAKVDDLEKDDIVIIGSSRVMFNFQLDEWEKIQGRKPVNIAAAGSTVLPVLEDIVENSSFSGTLIVGVTPPLYWVPQSMDVFPYARIQNFVNHFHNQTYAERLNHFLSKHGPQKGFSFLTSSPEFFYNELDLRTLIEQIPSPSRIPKMPPFPILYQVDDFRNVSLVPQMATDEGYVKEITDFWSFIFQPPSDPNITMEMIEENRRSIIDKSAQLLSKFKARGGRVIMVRCPSQNKVREIENSLYPRATYWNALVKEVDAPAYHFEDYSIMNKYKLPEWSHLSTSDAKSFTKDFIDLLKKDNLL
ncbi:hypothetical protein OE09_0700 [Flavobacteriaceae bacterium MAR_2010_72]|nr:hypothetical protein OE09_0700 [Flavobacteriaceae bacterium MAR_2010_72]